MTFQFQCPAGHLLSGDPAHAGQQCTCPMCGMVFIIPSPLPTLMPETQPQAPAMPPGPPSPPSPPASPVGESPMPPAPPALPASPVEAPAAIEISKAPAAATTQKQEKLLHIPCPNGHELECPPDMLGQDVLCPECNAQFTLRERDSEEYKRKKKRERDRKEKKLGDAWFNFAVVVGVLVLIGIVTLVLMVWFGEPPEVDPIERRPPPTFGAPTTNPDLESNPGAETNPESDAEPDRPAPAGDRVDV